MTDTGLLSSKRDNLTASVVNGGTYVVIRTGAFFANSNRWNLAGFYGGNVLADTGPYDIGTGSTRVMIVYATSNVFTYTAVSSEDSERHRMWTIRIA